VKEVIGAARQALLEECDYEREARYQERFARTYEHHPTLRVPAVHPSYCSRRVLTTSWADGCRFDEFVASNPPRTERDRIGEALFEFYVGTLLRSGLYNWDPHPGNYLVAPTGELVMLDYGSTREFDRSFVKNLAALTRAVHMDTPEALHDALAALGIVRTGQRYDVSVARSLVRSFYGPMLHDEVLAVQPGEARPFLGVLSSKRELLKLHLRGELLFVLRIRFGLMSVLAELGARANWYRLELRYADNDFAR
jgi:predicted unusual protein kinase regulating ubiquinone biosynthesis (AarF/ABC1/UbiB family)